MAMEAIFHRVSIRQYTGEQVSEEQIQLLLRAAMAAPSACNQQPWEFYVVTDAEKRAALAKATPFTLPACRAPLVIVPCVREEGCKAPAMVQQDLSAATENILLQADAMGLGTVWMGLMPMTQRMKYVSELLGMPDGLQPFCLIAVGHPAEERPQQDRYDENRIHRI